MKIGDAVKLCRIKKKIQQRELARRIGMASSQLSLIEHGKREPNQEQIKKIAKALGIPHSLIMVMASEQNEHAKKYKKQVDAISRAVLDIFSDLS